MKNKLKVLNIIEISIMVLLVGITVLLTTLTLLGDYYKEYFTFMWLLVLFTMALPLTSLIFQAIKEAKVLDYHSNNYSIVVKQLIMIIGVGIYLVLVNALDRVIFPKYAIYFYIALPLAVLIPIMVGIVLNKRKPSNNNPKIIKNR